MQEQMNTQAGVYFFRDHANSQGYVTGAVKIQSPVEGAMTRITDSIGVLEDRVKDLNVRLASVLRDTPTKAVPQIVAAIPESEHVARLQEIVSRIQNLSTSVADLSERCTL